jgi:hypothetical protein
MTVEEYLRSLVPGLDLQDNVIARAARSPIEVNLERLDVDDDIDDYDDDQEFQKRLDYASSTIYYSVLGVFAGGGFTEQVGDVRTSRGGFIITKDDRARYKALGDALRQKWGFDVADEDTGNEMYDATYMRR